MDENTAKVHFKQLASAVEYLHSRKICHRDLKLENVLLASLDDKNPVLKITDMGLSKLLEDTVLKTFCGTRGYLAPEIVKGISGLGEREPYTVKVDCWALGVILYELLSGSPPFSDERKAKCNLNIRDQILTANFVLMPAQFGKISHEAKDLIIKLLKVNPEDRISASQIIQHKWLKVSISFSAVALLPSKFRILRSGGLRRWIWTRSWQELLRRNRGRLKLSDHMMSCERIFLKIKFMFF